MLIGIFSDTHDNLPQIDKALAIFKQREVQAVLHAGDIVAPFAAKRIAKIDVPLYIIYGNNDGERAGLKAIFPQISDGPILITIDNCIIAMAHDFSQIPQCFCDQANVLVAGHTHKAMIKTEKNKLMINPGECSGWLKDRPTIAILDTQSLKTEIIDLS